jgi:hypothetical protein
MVFRRIFAVKSLSVPGLPAGYAPAYGICAKTAKHPWNFGEKYQNPDRTAGTVRGMATHTYWTWPPMKIRNISTVAMPPADPHSVPMIRLFDAGDIEFLRGVPGYTAAMETEFRRRRCRIFLGYLRSLKAEVLAAQTELETLRIESPEDYQQVAVMVMRCRMRFAWAMIPAYLRLFQYRWELGSTQLGPVVQRFEGIRGEMRHWIPEIS